MCNLLKAAVACLPRLSKSNHPLLCHCLWASVIDEQLSQLQGGLHKWTSHQIPPTIKCCIPPPIARPLLFSELYFHLVPHPLRTNMFSEVAVFSTGSFFEVHIPLIQLAILQAAICTTQQAWTSIGCCWPPFLPFASLKLVPQWFISLWMAGSACAVPLQWFCTHWVERRASRVTQFSLHLYHNTWQPSSNWQQKQMVLCPGFSTIVDAVFLSYKHNE